MVGRLLVAYLTGILTGGGGAFLAFSFLVPAAGADCRDHPCDSPPCCNGDCNGDGTVNIADAIFLLSYLFARGPEPAQTACGPNAECCPPSRLPATGDITCTNGEDVVVDCADPPFLGEDGHYRAGCPVEGRFVDNGDGTVTDMCTGLTWEQDPPVQMLGYYAALAYCEDLSLADHDDWRLPNYAELESIVDYGRAAPAIDPAFRAEPSFYWSSTRFAGWIHKAKVVDFLNDGRFYDTVRNPLFIRAVRGGL